MIREKEAAKKLCPYKAQNSDLTRRGVKDVITCAGSNCMAWAKNVSNGYTYLRSKNLEGPLPAGMMQVDYKPTDNHVTRDTQIRIAADPEFGYCRLIQPDFPERS